MPYVYLVGFVIEAQLGASQIGKSIIVRNKPILNSKDVEDTELKLQEDFGAKKVVLLSFSKLEDL